MKAAADDAGCGATMSAPLAAGMRDSGETGGTVLGLGIQRGERERGTRIPNRQTPLPEGLGDMGKPQDDLQDALLRMQATRP